MRAEGEKREREKEEKRKGKKEEKMGIKIVIFVCLFFISPRAGFFISFRRPERTNA